MNYALHSFVRAYSQTSKAHPNTGNTARTLPDRVPGYSTEVQYRDFRDRVTIVHGIWPKGPNLLSLCNILHFSGLAARCSSVTACFYGVSSDSRFVLVWRQACTLISEALPPEEFG